MLSLMLRTSCSRPQRHDATTVGKMSDDVKMAWLEKQSDMSVDDLIGALKAVWATTLTGQ